MKHLKIKFGFIILLYYVNFSCIEKDLLEEVPLDFLSLENSYQTMPHFESALTDLYARVRDVHYNNNGDNINTFAHHQSTDIVKHARGDANRFGNYNVWLVPTNDMVNFHWVRWYKIIANANTIISRLEYSELTEEQKKIVAAEAKFFRAFSYRYLVYLYGGVPIVLDEITSPKMDFVRSSKKEVLNQIISDAKEAAENLPMISNVTDGKISNLVAYHLLAETYNSLGLFDDAILAATMVIDDPSTSMMYERFGTRSAELEGDVYWDLFRRGNQNRSSGNLEALWVIQMEIDVPGGLITTSGSSKNALERFAVPAGWTLLDPDGRNGMTNQGKSDINIGGRGVSYMMNTNFFLYDLWKDDWNNDIRNSPHNIVRDIKYDNPNSVWYDSSAVKYPSLNWKNQNWRWYPWLTKVTTPGNHPDEMYVDKENQILKNNVGSTFRDMYLLRLAETYLLRAEAHLNKGDLFNSAKDINVVRQRSKANPVIPNKIDLDYILDERARELVYEEERRITLHRTNKLVERVRKYNDLNRSDIQDFHNLWPIPFSEIEANTKAILTQNPGYF
jgi:hypothetical protein